MQSRFNTVSQVSSPSLSAQQCYDKAKHYAANNQHNLTLQLLTQALKIDPQHWQKNPVKPQAVMRNPYTLGLRLTSSEQKPFYQGTAKPETPEEPKSLSDFVWSLIEAIYSKQNSDHVKLNEQDRTIYLDPMGVKTAEFDADQNKHMMMIESGESGVDEHFKSRLGETSKKSLLDIALENQQKPRILSLVKEGVYACQDPQKVIDLLKQALKSEWVDTQQVADDLRSFEAYHQHRLEHSQSISYGFF